MSNSFNNLPDSVLLEMLGAGSNDGSENYTNDLLQLLSDQELSNQVDTKVGSPTNVRAAVSAAQTKEDKLNTLRKFYPDALPVEAFDPKTEFQNLEEVILFIKMRMESMLLMMKILEFLEFQHRH
jgi:hypothetical protein